MPLVNHWSSTGMADLGGGSDTRQMCNRCRPPPLTNLHPEPVVALLHFAAHRGEKIIRVNGDAVQLHREHAVLRVDHDAAGWMQPVRVGGLRGVRARPCHQLVSMVISEPVRHSGDDLLFQLSTDYPTAEPALGPADPCGMADQSAPRTVTASRDGAPGLRTLLRADVSWSDRKPRREI